MADTVAVMNAGRVEQLGRPDDLYERPETTFVADFLGTSNLLEAEVVEAAGDDLVLTAGGAKLRLPAERCRGGTHSGARVLAGVRPEKLSLTHADEAESVAEGRNRLRGTVSDAGFLGVSTQYVVQTPAAGPVTVYQQNVERDARLVPGAEVVLHWNPAHTFGFDAASQGAGTIPRPTAGDDA